VRVAAMLVCVGAWAAHATPAEAKTWTVKITGMQFDPATVTVATGDTVVWVNEDPFQHTVTSSGARRFDSHAIAPGAKWRYDASTPGRYPYLCTFHPTMRATLIVKGKP
jgi:plastocyanin